MKMRKWLLPGMVEVLLSTWGRVQSEVSGRVQIEPGQWRGEGRVWVRQRKERGERTSGPREEPRVSQSGGKRPRARGETAWLTWLSYIGKGSPALGLERVRVGQKSWRSPSTECLWPDNTKHICLRRHLSFPYVKHLQPLLCQLCSFPVLWKVGVLMVTALNP